MEFVLLGWPEEGPTLRLDYRRFSYAGKFVMSSTGKAVVRGEGVELDGATPVELDAVPPGLDPTVFDDDVLAAAAFNEDRTDPDVLWIRYLTVARGLRGRGIGPRLVAFVVAQAEGRGYTRQRIAVNNAFSYESMYKVGFAFTGRETGLAELVLERPGDRDTTTYQRGLDAFRARDIDDVEAEFLAEREGSEPPARIEAPCGRLGHEAGRE